MFQSAILSAFVQAPFFMPSMVISAHVDAISARKRRGTAGFQRGVLRADARVVQPCGDGVRLLDLTSATAGKVRLRENSVLTFGDGRIMLTTYIYICICIYIYIFQRKPKCSLRPLDSALFILITTYGLGCCGRHDMSERAWIFSRC